MNQAIACLGSGEFEPWTTELDRLLLSGASGDGTVALMPTASAPDGEDVFKAWGTKGLEHYQALKAPARLIDLAERSDCFRRDLIDQIKDASMIFLSGGKPDYLAETLGGTPLWEAAVGAWKRGAALVGCSAGMCYFGSLAPSSTTIHPARARWVAGAELFNNVLLVPHWDSIDEHDPGAKPALLNGFLGDRGLLGVSEQTAVAKVGGSWRVFGTGAVTVVSDGLKFEFSPGDVIPDGLLHLTAAR